MEEKKTKNKQEEEIIIEENKDKEYYKDVPYEEVTSKIWDFYQRIKEILPKDFNLPIAIKIFSWLILFYILFIPGISRLYKWSFWIMLGSAFVCIMFAYLLLFILYKIGLIKLKGGQLGDEK